MESPTLITLRNALGAEAVVSTLGAGLVSLSVPDKAGKHENVVLTYANPDSYMNDGPCAGKVPGRYANRIAKGVFELDGKEYHLAINNGPNALHGGPTGFQNRFWNIVEQTPNSVTLAYSSADGEEGYPGNLNVMATYTLDENANTLRLRLQGATDATTVINLTNHTYFNLDGFANGKNVLDHILTLNADHWLPTDDTLIPTGEIAPVEATPMDFTKPKTLGRDIKADFPALKYGKGYDNCWFMGGSGVMKHAATLEGPESGRRLEVWTTQPAVQVYTGNWLDGCPEGPDGRVYHDYDAVAIECQNCPDAPHHPNFPDSRLNPTDEFDQTIEFRFA